MTVLEKKTNETARQYVLRVLRHNIIHLDLKPGQPISESEMAVCLGVSRTPVGEAFQDLANASIIEIQPQRGTFVSLIDLDIVEESRFLRHVLEKIVVELACDNISQEDLNALEENVTLQGLAVKRGDYNRFMTLDNGFHERLFKACGKGWTYNFISGMTLHFDRVRAMNLKEMDMSGPFSDHKNILEAVRDKDKERAVREMDRNLTRVTTDKIYLYGKYPEYFTKI